MDFVRNTRKCRLYNFDEGRWYTYREAAQYRNAQPVTESAAA
jgi:hypothetical protein